MRGLLQKLNLVFLFEYFLEWRLKPTLINKYQDTHLFTVKWVGTWLLAEDTQRSRGHAPSCRGHARNALINLNYRIYILYEQRIRQRNVPITI